MLLYIRDRVYNIESYSNANSFRWFTISNEILINNNHHIMDKEEQIIFYLEIFGFSIIKIGYKKEPNPLEE